MRLVVEENMLFSNVLRKQKKFCNSKSKKVPGFAHLEIRKKRRYYKL